MNKLILVCLTFASCATVYGTSVTGGTPCPTTPTSFLTYERDFSTAGCFVGIVDYTNFQFMQASASGVPAATASQVYLTPSGLGFSFTYGTIVPVNDYSNFTLQYDFDPAPVLGDASLSLDVQGDVSVVEQICPGGTFASGDCLIQGTDPTPVVLGVSNPGQLYDTAPLGVSSGEINLGFSLTGDQGPAGFDAVVADFALSNSTATPEPATVGFLLIGSLFGISKIRRSARRQQTS